MSMASLIDVNVFESKLDAVIRRKTDEIIKILKEKEERQKANGEDTSEENADQPKEKPKRTRAKSST